MLERKSFGYMIETNPGFTREMDTSTCGHCGRVSFIKPSPTGQIVVAPARCTICRGRLCEECYARGGCDPFEKQIEREERAYLMRKAITGS